MPGRVELALQEFEIESLEDLDAPDWSDSFVKSLIASVAVGSAISIAT